MTSMATAWKSFQAACIPANSPPVQRQEMQRAFYAGAAIMLHKLMECGASDDEAAAEAELSQIEAEIELYFHDLTKGAGNVPRRQ